MSACFDKEILAQSPTLPGLDGGSVRRAASWLRRIAASLRRRRDRAAALRVLMKLDDRLLEDAGFPRHQLRSLIDSRPDQTRPA